MTPQLNSTLPTILRHCEGCHKVMRPLSERPRRNHRSKDYCRECYRKFMWMATCHPERKHKSNGLCNQCYAKLAASRRQPSKQKASCHPDQPHLSKGLCKPCYMREYGAKHRSRPEVKNRSKERNWKHNGITFTCGKYDAMLKSQNGRCAICLMIPLPHRNLAVDHDHMTGIVRGLLCSYCNRRLLVARNTPDILRRAADYLSR